MQKKLTKSLQSINDLYPEHIRALHEANLLPPVNSKKLPKLSELWRRDKESNVNKKKNKKYGRRAVYFVHGHSKFWSNLTTPPHTNFKKYLIPTTYPD